MKYLASFLVLFATWVLLAGYDLYELIIGAVVSLIVSIIISKSVQYKIDYKFPVKILVFIFAYIPLFIYQLLLANLDVARRVLMPKIPLKPGFVKIKTDLKGDFGKLTLANSITLTPGTLTVDVKDDELYVHTVEVKGDTPKEHRENISSAFEKLLGVIFK